MKFKSDFLNELNNRGLINQCSNLDGLDEIMSKKKIAAYGGLDATATSFTIGNLVMITLMKWLQKTGHKSIVLLGGATTRIGDPSDKDKERPLLSEDVIKSNIEHLKKDLSKFIKFGDKENDAVLVDNYEWFKDIKYLNFLRDVGRFYTVNRMLTFEGVKRRLDREQSMTFLEFNYMLLQGYDFLELNKKYNCILQLCGADQWGNSICGLELGHKILKKEFFVLSAPLLTVNGQKISKSLGNSVYLSEEKNSPYEYYQYFRNVADEDVGKMLRIFTELPISEIEKLEKLEGKELNEAKSILAFEASKMCHGEEKAKQAEETSIKTFKEGGIGDNLPTIEIDKNLLESGISILDLYVTAKLTTSKAEARRRISGGGAYLNDEKIEDINFSITSSHLKDGVIKLSSGKKKHVLVKIK